MEAMEALFRWIHIVAGIMWIGHLYFFNFVNAPFEGTLDGPAKKIVVPQLRPRALYWFRWGAAWTWVTGFLLMLMVFYHGQLVFDMGGDWSIRAFVMVALPLVRPGIAAAALLAFIFAWNNYVFPLILADTNASTVTVAITKFLGGGGQAYYNLTAAAALIGALPPLVLALSIQRYLVRGLSFGAVKS